MGSIYKRGRNYYIDIRANGKRVRKKVGPVKHLAELVLKDVEVKSAKEKFDFISPDGQLSTLFQSFSDYSKTNHLPSTHLRYWEVLRNFQVFLAIKHKDNIKISQLTQEIIENYKSFRRNVDPRTIKLPDDFPYQIPANCSIAKTKTLNLEIKTLRSMFNYGIRMGFCRDNPFKSVPLLKTTDSKQPRFLSEQECRTLLDYCPKDLRPIFYTFIYTGLRLGELINLQWNDIDLKAKRLFVRKKDFWRPKSGEREVPLTKGMTEMLKKIRPAALSPKQFVFPGKDGKRLKRKLRQELIGVAKKAGIEVYVFK